MDRIKKTLNATLLVFFLILSFGMMTAEAGNYLGKFCWQDSGGEIVVLTLTDMGDGHFQINGRNLNADGTPADPLQGSGYIKDANTLIMQIIAIGYEPGENYGFFGTFVLDLTTFNGTVSGLDYGCDLGQANCPMDSVGGETFTFTQCP